MPSHGLQDMMGVAAGTAMAFLIVWCVVDYSRLLAYRGSGLSSAVILLLLVMAAEIACLFPCSGLSCDLNVYREWAFRLAQRGPALFYAPGYEYHWEYPPASMYPLWVAGVAGRLLHLSRTPLRLLIQIPPVVTNVLLAETLFVFLRKSGFSRAKCWTGTVVIALNPALLFDTVIWGQSDAIVTLLMWLAALFVLESKYELGAALAAVALLTKPHALLLIPLLALWALWHARPARWATAMIVFLAAIMIVTAPFQGSHPLDWLPRFYLRSLQSFRETSVNAFNFMALTGGLRQPDATVLIMGLSYFDLGILLSSCALMLSFYLLWRSRTPRMLMLAIFIALFGNFLFAPRMHERYLYPALVFFVPAILDSPFLTGAFVLITINWLFNLDYVFNALRTTQYLLPHDPIAMISSAFNVLGFGAIATYIAFADFITTESFATTDMIHDHSVAID